MRVDVPVGHPDFGRLEVCTCRRADINDSIRERLFTLSHLDELKEPQQWRDRKSGQLLTGLDAWVAVFQRKVDEIGAASCPA